MTAISLTREQAMAIREAFGSQEVGSGGLRVLAMRYGVSMATIRRVVEGEHPHVAGMPAIKRPPIRGAWEDGSRKLTGRQAQMLDHGKSARVTSADAKRVACPRCKARPGWGCVDPRLAPYRKAIKKIHPERREQVRKAAS